MPFKNKTEAEDSNFPTSLDDIDLTLGQINHIVEIYDRLEEEGEVNEPMPVAISTFKKAYNKTDDGWEREEAAMSEEKMDKLMNKQKKEFAELFRLDQKEIFKAGTWIDSQGNEHTFTDEDIDEIIEAFEKGVRSRDGIPLRFDNHGNKYDPAVGFVDRVWKKGKSLYASFKKIPKMVKELIENGQYERVSAGLIGDYKDPILKEKFNNVLDHVALLGAKAPGVKGLADWGKFYDEQGKVFVFSEGDKGLCQKEVLDTPEKEDDNIEDKEEKVMSEKLKQLNDKLSNEVADLKEEKDSMEKSFSEIKEEKANLEEKVEELNEKIEENKKDAKEKSIKSFLESEDVSKRITPAQMGMYEEVLMNAEDFEEKKEEILSYPEIIDFKEKSTASTEEEKADNEKAEFEDEMTQREGKKVELEGYELNKKAEKLVEEGEFDSKEDALIHLS